MLGLGFSFVFSPKRHISNGEGQSLLQFLCSSFPQEEAGGGRLVHEDTLDIFPADAKEKQLFLVEKEKKKVLQGRRVGLNES